MKFISVLLILATLLGVMTSSGGFCPEDSETAQVRAFHLVEAGSAAASAAAALDNKNFPLSADHEALPFHTCHLGHCSFLLPRLRVSLFVPAFFSNLTPYKNISLFDISFGLFRPPIV